MVAEVAQGKTTVAETRVLTAGLKDVDGFERHFRGKNIKTWQPTDWLLGTRKRQCLEGTITLSLSPDLEVGVCRPGSAFYGRGFLSLLESF